MSSQSFKSVATRGQDLGVGKPPSVVCLGNANKCNSTKLQWPKQVKED